MDSQISWIFGHRGYLDIMDIWASWIFEHHIFGHHGYSNIIHILASRIVIHLKHFQCRDVFPNLTFKALALQVPGGHFHFFFSLSHPGFCDIKACPSGWSGRKEDKEKEGGHSSRVSAAAIVPLLAQVWAPFVRSLALSLHVKADICHWLWPYKSHSFPGDAEDKSVAVAMAAER